MIFTLSSFAPSLKVLTLKANTPIQLELAEMLDTSQLQVGQNIKVRNLYDVKVDGEVVIAAGAMARAQVLRVTPAKGLGRPGSLELGIQTIDAVDGTPVGLAGGDVYREGKGKQGLAWGLGLFVCIFCLAIKGEDVTFVPGYKFDCRTAAEFDIEV